MSAQAADDYYSRRARILAERRAYQEEWDFLARRLDDRTLVDGVGHGWWPIVRDLNARLLALDPDFRLFSIEEEHGGLTINARFTSLAQMDAARLIQIARAQALATCELCGQPGALRAERLQMKTLCDDCWTSDRAAASQRGERYADAVLAQLLSADDDHPSPEDTLAWLDDLDAG